MRSINLASRILIALSLLVASAGAKEIIHFKSGFNLDAESHTMNGSAIEVKAGVGTMEFPVEQISSIDMLPQTRMPEPIAGGSALEQTPQLVLFEAAVAHGVDAILVRSVAQVESGLRQGGLSQKGAVGLMQLMPATAKQLGVDPSRLTENARGGVQYLRDLLIKYRGDSALALAAYNAGPGAVQKYRGIPPYPETRRYILSVLKEYSRLSVLQTGTLTSSKTKALSRPIATN